MIGFLFLILLLAISLLTVIEGTGIIVKKPLYLLAGILTLASINLMFYYFKFEVGSKTIKGSFLDRITETQRTIIIAILWILSIIMFSEAWENSRILAGRGGSEFFIPALTALMAYFIWRDKKA